MNQRSRNRRRNPLVLIGQLIKRRNGRWIAQNHGDLAATGNAFRLAFGAGLGLGHGLVRLRDFRHLDGLRAILGKPIHHGEDGITTAGCGNVIRNSLQLAAFRRGVSAYHAVEVHGLLQSGGIPPMDESYIVTSNSQHLSIVRRNRAGSAA